MPAESTGVGGDSPDLTRPILELAIEDWYGLWEIANDAARAVGAAPGTRFREMLRSQLATMIDRGLLEAAIWSDEAPKAISAPDVRNLAVDSELWKSPDKSSIDEQLRVSATEAGRKEYFGKPT